MGVTVTAFTNGTTMVATTMRSNLVALRRFTNRGAVGADYTGLFQGRHFVRPESYGSPSPRTVMASGITWGSGVDGGPVQRAYGMYDAMGTEWRWVPGGARTLYVPENGTAEICVTVWAWHIKSGQEWPEASGGPLVSSGARPAASYDNTLEFAAKVAIRIEGTVRESTERRIWDAGTDPATNYAAGPYRYSAVNRSMTTLVDLTQGEQTIGLVSKMEAMTVGSDLGQLTIGARMTIVEFMRR